MFWREVYRCSPLLLEGWGGECRSFGGGCEYELNQTSLRVILSSSRITLFPLQTTFGSWNAVCRECLSTVLQEGRLLLRCPYDYVPLE